MLLRIRIDRLRRGPATQHPASWSQHVLQTPEITLAAPDHWLTRTAFYYTEARGDKTETLTGVVEHHLVREGGALRIQLKRINLLNCDAALPSIQLFL